MTCHLQRWHIHNDITFTMLTHLQWHHIYNDVTFTMMFWLPSTITSLKFLNDIDNSTPGGLLVGWISATQKYTTVHQCCSYMYTLNVTCIDTLQHMAFPLGCRVYQQIFGGVKSLSRWVAMPTDWLVIATQCSAVGLWPSAEWKPQCTSPLCEQLHCLVVWT